MTLKVQARPILVALAVLVVLIAGTVFASRAVAGGVTVHNNYSSGKDAYALSSGGTYHYVDQGETWGCGSYCRVHVPSGWDVVYGYPGTAAIGKRTATGWWTFSNSLWVKFVRE